MFFKYLRRELGKRRKQTALVASGLAVAIGLVVVVDAASVGVQQAQAGLLESLYGIGTDISISRTNEPQPGEGRQRFEIGSEAGTAGDGSRTFSRSRLTATPFQSMLTADEVATVSKADGVAAVTGTLKLTNTTFNGELPEFMLNPDSQQGQGPGQMDPNATATAEPAPRPSGGFDGEGGSAFDVTTFTVEGIDPAVSDLGPLSGVSLSDGRLLSAEDAEAKVALLDLNYATTEEIAVGDTIKVGGKSFEVVGIVESTSTASASAANVYIPLGVAQTLSGNEGEVSNLYVTAESADLVTDLDAALTAALPDATVNSSSELADGVTGTLGSAASLIQNLGKWLSYAVLAAAFLIASLLTASGVSRRTREFGTLKAIGWRNRRIVGQVLGESLVTGFIGAVAGIGVGAAGVWAVNRFAPVLTASVGTSAPEMGPGMGGPGGGRFAELFNNTVDLTLNAAISPSILATALALALLGGLLAGGYGGWRAARLSPAESLRSVA